MTHPNLIPTLTVALIFVALAIVIPGLWDRFMKSKSNYVSDFSKLFDRICYASTAQELYDLDLEITEFNEVYRYDNYPQVYSMTRKLQEVARERLEELKNHNSALKLQKI